MLYLEYRTTQSLFHTINALFHVQKMKLSFFEKRMVSKDSRGKIGVLAAHKPIQKEKRTKVLEIEVNTLFRL